MLMSPSVPVPGLDALEQLGDLGRAELAGRALAARLDGEELGEEAGHVDHAGAVVVDDEAGPAEAGAAGSEVLVGPPGRSKRDGSITGFATPEKTAFQVRPAVARPPGRRAGRRGGCPSRPR